MAWKALVTPNLNVSEAAGNCLIFTRKVFGAPAGIPSARESWDATQYKHRDFNFPNVAVPVYFDHVGTYGNPPVRKNWGHVVAYIPGRGYFSSPNRGAGGVWYQSIGEVEKAFNANYLGWTEDINGKRVAINEGGDMPITKEQEQVVAILATGSLPGKDYNYPFVGTNNLDGMLNFWRAQPDELAKLADLRLSWLNAAGEKVSVKAPIDGNNINQVLANIGNLYKLIDEKDKIIDSMNKNPAGFVEVGNNTGLYQKEK